MSTHTYKVTGMTCGHCVSAVTEEVQAIPGVTDVRIELAVGGQSTLSIDSNLPITDESVATAVDEAGYEVVRL